MPTVKVSKNQEVKFRCPNGRKINFKNLRAYNKDVCQGANIETAFRTTCDEQNECVINNEILKCPENGIEVDYSCEDEMVPEMEDQVIPEEIEEPEEEIIPEVEEVKEPIVKMPSFLEKYKMWIIIGVVILLVLLVYWFFFSGRREEVSLPRIGGTDTISSIGGNVDHIIENIFKR